MLVVKCIEGKIRKSIHEYFERKKYYNKASITLDKYEQHIERFFICKDCKIKFGAKYYEGLEENNIDEYYSSYCPGCDRRYEYECNYNDFYLCNFFRIYHNNTIMFSDLISNSKSYEYDRSRIPSEIESFDHIKSILMSVFHIDESDIHIIEVNDELRELSPIVVHTGKKGKPR